MPAYDKHLIGGFITFLCLAFVISTPVTTQTTYISWLFFCLFGSLFPDIDTKSHIQRWFYALTILCLICAYMAKFEFSYLLTLLFVPLIVRHIAMLKQNDQIYKIIKNCVSYGIMLGFIKTK